MPTPKPARQSIFRLPSTKRGRRILLAVGAAVLVVALVVGGIIAFSGDKYADGTDTATEAVVAYIDALARGDAETALSLARTQPPDRSLLTDEVLKIQNEKFPIRDVRILGEVPISNGNVSVRLLATLGDVHDDYRITLKKPPPGEGWKLDSAVMTVELSKGMDSVSPELLKYMTLFGKPAPKSGKAYAFPGWIELGSSNPNLEVTEGPLFNQQPSLSNFDGGSQLLFPDFTVSDAGADAVREQLKKLLDECAESTKLAPPGCPQETGRYDLEEGSAKWTAPTDLTGITMSTMGQDDGEASFSGEVEFKVTARTTRGETDNGTITASVYGTADMLQDPPKIELES